MPSRGSQGRAESRLASASGDGEAGGARERERETDHRDERVLLDGCAEIGHLLVEVVGPHLLDALCHG